MTIFDPSMVPPIAPLVPYTIVIGAAFTYNNNASASNERPIKEKLSLDLVMVPKSEITSMYIKAEFRCDHKPHRGQVL